MARPQRKCSALAGPGFASTLLVGGLLAVLAAPAWAQSAGPSRHGGDPSLAEERLSQLRATGAPAHHHGTLDSVQYALDVAGRTARSFPEASAAWRRRAERQLVALEAGRDPFLETRGAILNRGYRSPVSTRMQGYAIYTPPDYDPAKRYPLMVVLHGGSSNGNLFLGVVLGNNMNWKEYDQHLWDEYRPRWSPDWIVVAPDGFGQVMWRWMGERDVLDVIADVQRHYSVDTERIVLSGLSNGGVGAYAMAARHGDLFSAVQAIAGAPSWVLYAGERSVSEPERYSLRAMSALDLAPNVAATDFRYYHGDVDPGPMRPAYVRAFSEQITKREVRATETWYEAGHDLLYRVHRHGRGFKALREQHRNRSPKTLHLVSGDLRAARQHWLTITEFEGTERLAEVRASAGDGRVVLQTEATVALSIDLRSLPGAAPSVAIEIDGSEVVSGPRASMGARLHFYRSGKSWRAGFPPSDKPRKTRGVSGPLTDAYFDRMVHVYGTAIPEQTDALRQAAEKGALGWPKWLWGVKQEVVADSEVTGALAGRAHLVLYGTPGANRVLERISERLPIRITGDAVFAGEREWRGPDVGVRFIYPNPESPRRYVIVQAATTPPGVALGHNLPDFLPDYVIYDARSARRRPRLVPGSPKPLARGYFDPSWRLPKSGREQ